MNKSIFNKFSIPLGLLDYINPIFYSISIITIIRNIYLEFPYNIIMILGAILSIIFGFIIPTGKVIVGMGLIKFRMPVSLVFMVNTGILLSGLMLLKYVFNFNSIVLFIIIGFILILLLLIYCMSKKFNTIAVLIGMFGYLLLYISLIIISFRLKLFIPIILYLLAIVLFLMLVCIGIKANLKNPKVHWVIEISNVLCQFLVMIGTLILF